MVLVDGVIGYVDKAWCKHEGDTSNQLFGRRVAYLSMCGFSSAAITLAASIVIATAVVGVSVLFTVATGGTGAVALPIVLSKVSVICSMAAMTAILAGLALISAATVELLKTKPQPISDLYSTTG
jgi:hypothetical protein